MRVSGSLTRMRVCMSSDCGCFRACVIVRVRVCACVATLSEVVDAGPFGGRVVEGDMVALSLPKRADPIFLTGAAALPPVALVGAGAPV